MPSICAVSGCSNKAGKDKVSFFSLPIVRNRSGEIIQKLSLLRHEKWLKNIGRQTYMENTSNWRVCSEHFISGRPAPLYMKTDPDWAPTLNMGHNNINTATLTTDGRIKEQTDDVDLSEDRSCDMCEGDKLSVLQTVENIHTNMTNNINHQHDDIDMKPFRQQEQIFDSMTNQDCDITSSQSDLAKMKFEGGDNLSVLQIVENIHTNNINHQHDHVEMDSSGQQEQICDGLTNGSISRYKNDDIPEEMSCDSPVNSAVQLEEKVYTDSRQSSRVMRRLAELWREEKLCDAEISNGTTTMKAHKVMLIATCPALLSLNKSIWSQTVLVVHIPSNIESDTINAFLVYLYEGVLRLTAESLPQMKTLATSMNVDSLLDYCEEFQTSIMSVEQKSEEPCDNKTPQTRANTLTEHQQHSIQTTNPTKLSQAVRVTSDCSFKSDVGTHCFKQPSSHPSQSRSTTDLQSPTRHDLSPKALCEVQPKSGLQPKLRLVASNKAGSQLTYSLQPIKQADSKSSSGHCVLPSNKPNYPSLSNVIQLPFENKPPDTSMKTDQRISTQSVTAPLQTLTAPMQTLTAPIQTLTSTVQTLPAPTHTVTAPTETVTASTQSLTAPTQAVVTPKLILTAPTQSWTTPTQSWTPLTTSPTKSQIPLTLIPPTQSLTSPTQSLTSPKQSHIPLTLVPPAQSLTSPTQSLKSQTLQPPTPTQIAPTQTLTVPMQTLMASTKTLTPPTQTLRAPTQTLLYQVASSVPPIATTSSSTGSGIFRTMFVMYNKVPEARRPVPVEDTEILSDPSLYFKRGHRLKHQYRCEKCSMLLFTEPHTVQHMETVHQVDAKDVMDYVRAERPSSVIPCGICEHTPKENTDQIQYHRYFQHKIPLPSDLKVHRCDTCSKEFRKQSQLLEHKNTHKDHASYVCEICGMGFAKIVNCRMHAYHCHNEEKRFVCKKCGKGCKTRCAMNIHLRSHTGLRPFKCPQCSYEGTTKGNLKVHMWKHHKQSVENADVPGFKDVKHLENTVTHIAEMIEVLPISK